MDFDFIFEGPSHYYWISIQCVASLCKDTTAVAAAAATATNAVSAAAAVAVAVTSL